MIFVTRIPNVFDERRRVHELAEYRYGMKVRDIVHEPWPLGRVVQVDGRDAEPSATLHDDARVLTYDRPAGPAAVPYLIAFGVSTVLGVVASSLAPKPPARRGDVSSPTYSWSGIQSARGEGNPVPKVFGQIRTGGQVLAEFTKNKGKSGSFLYRLIGFGYGPFGALAGVEFDTAQDQPLRSMHEGDLGIPRDIWMGDKRLNVFRSADVHVRLGTPSQLTIEGFDRTTQTITVGQDMKRPEANSDSAVEQYLPASPSPTDDPTMAEYAIEVDCSEEDIDGVTVQVRFPQGLYSLGSSGDITAWFASLRVEIQEKDSNGNLITTGGPHADGILRFRPTPYLSAAVQGDLAFDWFFPCYDIDTYTQPAFGKLGTFNFENSFTEAWMENTSPTLPGSWSGGSPFDAFTVGAWIVLRPNGTTTGDTGASVDDTKNTVDNPIFSFLKTSTNEGIELCVGTRTFTLSPGQTKTRIVPIAKCGDASTTREFYQLNPSGQTSGTADDIGEVDFRCVVHQQNDVPTVDFARVFVTYKADAVNGLDRLRIYAQGELLIEVLDTLDIVCSPQGWKLGRDDASDSTNKRYFKGHMDVVLLDSREWTETEIERDYNTGRGVEQQTTSTMAALYQFENSPAVTGNGATTPDDSSNSNTLTLKLNPSGGTASFIRAGSIASIVEKYVAGNITRKGKYVVRVASALRDVKKGNRIDDMRLEAVQTHVTEEFNFAGEPVLAIKVRADEEGAGTPSDSSAIVKGLKCRVYTGTETPTPSYTEEFTRNPAWQCLADVQSRTHGMGQYLDSDEQTLRDAEAWAVYCDELVYDLRGRTTFDDVDTDAPVFDLTYDSTLFSGFGGIVISFRTSPTIYRPPAHWKVGKRLAFRDLPATGGGIAFGINVNEDFLGFEIGTVAWNGGNWEVTVKFDSATYGNPWTDGQQFAITYGSPITCTIEGREERFVFDGVFDAQRQAWDDLQRHAGVGHGRVYLDGNAARFSFEGPVSDAEIFDVVGMGNIVKGSFAWKAEGKSQRPNAYDAEFLDEDREFERALESREDPTLQGTTTLDQIRRESVDLFGTCRRSQAVREVYFRLTKNRLVSRFGAVRVGVDSIAWVPSVVVQLAHDLLPGKGLSGRVLETDADDSVKIDRTIVLAAATTYKLAVRSSAGDALFEVREITSSSGTYAPGDSLTLASALSFIPVKDDLYNVFVAGTENKVRVGDMTLQENLERRVALELYVPELFDFDALVPDIPLANA